MFVISPRWGTSLEDHFFFFGEESSWSRLKQRDFFYYFFVRRETRRGMGVEFWEISGRKEDENRGFLVPCGITPRCAEWETGMQNDRERSQTDSSASSSSGVNKMWKTCCCFVLYAATHNILFSCPCNPYHLDLRLVVHPVWRNRSFSKNDPHKHFLSSRPEDQDGIFQNCYKRLSQQWFICQKSFFNLPPSCEVLVCLWGFFPPNVRSDYVPSLTSLRCPVEDGALIRLRKDRSGFKNEVKQIHKGSK